MYNRDIRRLIEQNRIRYFEVANRLGITDSHFSRLLRWELPLHMKSKILEVVEELKGEMRGGNEESDD